MKIITPFTGMSEKNWNSSWKIRRTNRCPCISGASATTAADPPGVDLTDVTKLIKERAEELEIIHSNPEAYFKERKAAKTSYPVVEKSLNPVAEGCYTSQVRVKQKHRLLENEILVGEKMATQAELLYGTKYPKEEIHEAVRALLFSEFHDALPGSGTQQVEEDTLRLAGSRPGADVPRQLQKRDCADRRRGADQRRKLLRIFIQPTSVSDYRTVRV